MPVTYYKIQMNDGLFELKCSAPSWGGVAWEFVKSSQFYDELKKYAESKGWKPNKGLFDE